jgi:hypothetical protein
MFLIVPGETLPNPGSHDIPGDPVTGELMT